MPPKTQPAELVMHLEAHPKAVKRALRGLDHGLGSVEVRASDNSAGEHGKTTITYTHALDPAAHEAALNRVGKQANIEQDLLLRDDDEGDA